MHPYPVPKADKASSIVEYLSTSFIDREQVLSHIRATILALYNLKTRTMTIQ